MESRYFSTSNELVGLDGNVLILTGCSKRKIALDESMEKAAKDMYQGRLFKYVRKYAELKDFRYLIISAKYGLIEPDDTIRGYDKAIKTKADIEIIKPEVVKKLSKIIENYDTILVIAGKNYRLVLEELWDNRFIFLKTHGYLLMAKMVNDANKMIRDPVQSVL